MVKNPETSTSFAGRKMTRKYVGVEGTVMGFSLSLSLSPAEQLPTCWMARLLPDLNMPVAGALASRGYRRI